MLVVDDNRTNREILRDRLEGWDMSVCCVESAADALAEMGTAAQQGRPFDLAILDMHMPGMDGMQLATAIQEQAALRSTRLMMLSSTYADADSDARARAGVLRYLYKPVRRGDLLQAMASLLNGASGTTPSPAPKAPPAMQLLHGRVLLVEDNPINRGVAKAMLSKIGLQYELANHGAEAVNQVQRHAFDLVLMDCQMPVMDGFEATRIIRAMPDPARQAMPIVALTANAMQGNEQACLQAGMNAFLAKPYTLAALHATLAPFLDRGEPVASAGTTTPAQAPAAAPPAGAINCKTIDALRELDEDASAGLIAELVGSFIDNADQNLDRLAQAIQASDAKAVAQAAHSLKSSAANLGVDTLARHYREIESAARRGDLSTAPNWLPTLRAEQASAIAALRALLTETA